MGVPGAVPLAEVGVDAVSVSEAEAEEADEEVDVEEREARRVK